MVSYDAINALLVELVERMTEESSVTLYKSNEKTFGKEEWRYCSTPTELTHYQLDYRFILHRTGGINCSMWEYDRKKHNGLSSSAYYLVNDILTVANNIGFNTLDCPSAGSVEWQAGKKSTFYYKSMKSGELIELMTVKAFLNGNLHLCLNQAFMMRLNVEFGRLKGWLKTAQEAACELGISEDVAIQSFNANESDLKRINLDALLPQLNTE